MTNQPTREQVLTLTEPTARRLVDFLAELRQARGVSQLELAHRMHRTQSCLSKMENCRDGDLRLGDVLAYAAALGIEVSVHLEDVA